MESLPRIDFVELHDLDRTPAVLRTLHTESIAFIYRLTDAAREYSQPLALALRSGADHRIVDLCAGSGGPVARPGQRVAVGGWERAVLDEDGAAHAPTQRSTRSRKKETTATGATSPIAEPSSMVR